MRPALFYFMLVVCLLVALGTCLYAMTQSWEGRWLPLFVAGFVSVCVVMDSASKEVKRP